MYRLEPGPSCPRHSGPIRPSSGRVFTVARPGQAGGKISLRAGPDRETQVDPPTGRNSLVDRVVDSTVPQR
jgi:hypothetical protein